MAQSSDVRNFLLASHAHCLWIFGIHVCEQFSSHRHRRYLELESLKPTSDSRTVWTAGCFQHLDRSAWYVSARANWKKKRSDEGRLTVKFLGVPLGQCSCLVCSHRLALWNDPLPNPILHRRLSRIPHYTSRRRYPNHCLFEYHLRSRSTLLPSIPHHRTFRVPPIHCGQLAYRIVRHRAENQFRSTSCQGSHVTTIFYGHKKRHRASPCRA